MNDLLKKIKCLIHTRINSCMKPGKCSLNNLFSSNWIRIINMHSMCFVSDVIEILLSLNIFSLQSKRENT